MYDEYFVYCVYVYTYIICADLCVYTYIYQAKSGKLPDNLIKKAVTSSLRKGKRVMCIHTFPASCFLLSASGRSEFLKICTFMQ